MKIYTIEDLMKDYFGGLDVFPLYTTKAMAQRWGKTPDFVYNRYRRDETFPEPLEGVVKGLKDKQMIFPFYEVQRYEKENNLLGDMQNECTSGTKTTT